MKKVNFLKESDTLKPPMEYWKVLIADDEHDVHTVTKTALRNFVLKGKGLEFISAYSGQEALDILAKQKDIAVILLDVVMESDTAGLQLVKIIREDLENDLMRIILRTGQPGSAPEKEVILKYKINDYKEKTELTAKKLFSTMVAAIRSYQDLSNLQKNRDGLELIIDASKSILKKDSVLHSAEGLLTQLISLFNLGRDSVLINLINGVTIEKERNLFNVINVTGNLDQIKDFNEIDQPIKDLIIKAVEQEETLFLDSSYVGYFKIDDNLCYIIYVSGGEQLSAMNKKILEIFSTDTAVALHNLALKTEILNTQKEVIETLGEVVERRSKETSHHVKRVAQLSYLLAIDSGLSTEDANLLRMASPMHDIGKIGIPDSILLKPGKLTKDEFEIMKEHTTIGYEILKHSNRNILRMAAIIAYEHHEKFDGKGFPHGKKADDIHIFGRITAIADVFDALSHKRCYKDPWTLDEIFDFFKEERGKHFDPKLIDHFFANPDKYVDVIQPASKTF